MVPKTNLSRLGRAYVSAVIVLGFLVIGGSLYQLYDGSLPYQWFLLAGLTLITGSTTVKLPSKDASISISDVFVFSAVLLYGPSAGTVIVALDGFVISIWLAKRHREPHRALFNISAPAVSVWCAAQLFFIVSGIAPLAQHATPLNQILPPLLLFALAYFCLNTWLVTFAIAFARQINPLTLWLSGFAWLSLTYFCAASVSVLLVVYNSTLDFGFLSVIVPLLLVLHFTFKTSMGRVEDSDRHLQQLNTLYLSTIETLAMAIDAKDQITHGHIRRVQTYAVGLAKHVGVTDNRLIRAIEAAALLHDMGKLAVPEYILNKPGKLTLAEFEKMKLHASVGADILTAIDFPYPVVPIVRHHHENWDGTGYPQCLKGTEIPIGARILSVVDCFDALTSDRPYRPRLSVEEAISVLLERRGSMYDPLIIDTFVRVHEEIAPAAGPSGPPRDALNEITSSTQGAALLLGSARLDEIAASADEMLTLYELARALAGRASISDTGDVIAKHLRRLIPSSLCVFYLYDSSTDELEAKYALGEATPEVKGLRIALGQRLSGWVAANRQTIVNSDPTLDLGEIARCVAPRLRSCLSTPLLSDDTLVGVLTLYSVTLDGFTEDHRRIVEGVARQIAHTFQSAANFDDSARRDQLTGLPSLKQFEHVVDSVGANSVAKASLLFIDIVDLKQINTLHGRSTGDDVLRHVVRQARSALRVADILFRYGGDEFVVLLYDTDPDTATAVALRIEHCVSEQPFSLKGGGAMTINATVTCLCAPRDGRSLSDLLTTARIRILAAPMDRLGPSVH